MPRGRNPATKHGMWLTPEYKAWVSIKSRCFNPKDMNYRKYGARGVTMCAEWLHDFEAFYRHIGPRPSPAHSVDRFPNGAGNYEAGNVRWATAVEQNNNRNCCRPVEYKGEVKNVAQWAREFGIDRGVLGQRLRRGWSMEKAIATPLRPARKRKACA